MIGKTSIYSFFEAINVKNIDFDQIRSFLKSSSICIIGACMPIKQQYVWLYTNTWIISYVITVIATFDFHIG